MAIILTEGRPAIDVIQGSFSRPEEPWAHLGDLGPRTVLQEAIPAVGRYAFVAGPNLLLAMFLATKPGEDLFVGFGHEVIAAEPVRVRVEEILYQNELWKVQLLRATLPESLKPLRLSVRHPEELLYREVALIGYPALDQRNDPEVMGRLFRGVYDVKRLLPGRIRGYQPSPGREQPTLVHDCTSTGGCGGAPLVDVETGEVLGLHFAGSYLHANYAVPSWELARDRVFAEHGVVFAGPLPAAVSLEERTEEPDEPVADLSEARVERTEDETTGLDPDDLFSLEGIVLAVARPALLVDEGRPKLEGEWEPILKRHEARLALAIRAVGKLYVDEGSLHWVGTAYVVGDGLAMTASFSVMEFASGAGGNVTLKSGRRPAIDFGEALGLSPGEATARVTGVRFIHPFFQVALLELDQLPAGVAMLDLAAQMPPELADRDVVVLSYAHPGGGEAGDVLERIYSERWGRLFVQPGKALQLGQTPGLSSVPALIHDCTTTVGSAGAPVLDLGTGYVIGVHTHSKLWEGGYAQPTWELARDPYVWRHPIRFRPDPKPSWLDEWKDPQPVSSPQPASPEPRPRRWTVDDPLEFERDEPKELERLLYENIGKGTALYLAENVYSPLRWVEPSLPQPQFWREILRKAYSAGMLRRLIEAIAAHPDYAGIAPKLRESL